MKRITLFVVLVGLWGCTSTSLQTADGKNTLTDSAPWDSVAAISTGPGCQVPNPYVPPAPTPAPAVMTMEKLCDSQGANCQNVMMSRTLPAADDPNLCVTTVAQTKGIGMAGFLGGLAGIVSSILVLAGSSGL